MDQFDVVIAGGAMAGATFALTLANLSANQLQIAVVEPFSLFLEPQSLPSNQNPGFDNRCIALSWGTVANLKKIGIWPLLADKATAINQIHVSEQASFGLTEITSQDIGHDELGYVVELADVGKVYRQLLSQNPAITLFSPQRITNIKRSIESIELQLEPQYSQSPDQTNQGQAIQSQTIKSKLLVAADGADSFCCQQVGLEQIVDDFEQTAIIANIQTALPHQGQAFERFTPTGPLALLPMNQLPMSKGRMSLVWCVASSSADTILSLNDADFISQLQAEFGWRLGAIERVGARHSYPLSLRYHSQNISHRFACVGNAAQTLHPIAGQGFNLGMRDVTMLAETLVKYLDDVGCYRGLNEFRQRREQDRQQTIDLTRSLVRIFSNQYMPLKFGRNSVLATMDLLPSLKRPLLTQTLGLIS